MTNILADNRHDTGWSHMAEMEQIASDAAAAEVPYRANLVQMRADGIAATAEERGPVEVGSAIHQQIEQEAKSPSATINNLLHLLTTLLGEEAKMVGGNMTATERKNDPEYRAARKEDLKLRQAATGFIYRYILDGGDKGRTLDEVLRMSIHTVGPILAAEIIRTLENVLYVELTDDNRIVADEYLHPRERRDVREEVQMAQATERAINEPLN